MACVHTQKVWNLIKISSNYQEIKVTFDVEEKDFFYHPPQLKFTGLLFYLSHRSFNLPSAHLSYTSTLGSLLSLNTRFVFLMCVVYVLYCICNFVCCVLSSGLCIILCYVCYFVFFCYCSTTATGYKPTCS